MPDMGKLLIILGIVLVSVGLIVNFLPNIPKLPGDIYIDKPGLKVYFPIASSILISIILTIILNLFRR